MSQANLEKRRGLQDSSRQIAALRERWPAAFPAKPYDIKPLELGVLNRIMAVMGWSKPYTSGVLVPWKASAAYCRAVLCIERRITLEGEPAEPVDDEARTMAQERLAFLKARQDQKRKALAPAAAAPIAAPPAKAPAVVGESKPTPQPQPALADSSGRLSLAGLKAAYRQRQQAGAA
jgi:sRNA-binding protein